ncbi:hypothetical protein AMS68_005050 [Peltaster fructicola]|uniref:Alpha-ketoglutarate-dependent sulfonate dioxygenase n=1 Tax=Peltaster fructicola TaxID=286661 RepID=A0A6H0XXQ2_9PEZI|nr:hypothetical protein AMS68_005050 [Peltaster fructicola]
MPGRLSKLFSRGDKEKEALADAEANRNSTTTAVPPPYGSAPVDFDAEEASSAPDITAGFSNLRIRLDKLEGIPELPECVAHLKLLECFYRLQQKIGSTDGLYGIHDSAVLSIGLPDDSIAELLSKLAEKRWAVYVARAVDRFESWSQARFPCGGQPTISMIHYLGRIGYLTLQTNVSSGLNGPPLQAEALSENDLPPLDVLLVWHAFMLNPRAYFEDCLRKGKMHMWQHNFPWELVARAIDSETFIYTPNETSIVAFVASTGRVWDNNDESSGKRIICPKCRRINEASWTVIDNVPISASSLEQAKQLVEVMLSSGTGYCDQNLLVQCVDQTCRSSISHEYLKVGKFCRDIYDLQSKQTPMPGTLFGRTGIPQRIGARKDAHAARVLENTNHFFSAGLVRTFLTSNFNGRSTTTMADVRAEIDLVLKDWRYMRKASTFKYSGFRSDERAALRRVMSRYWNNSSDFSIDLVGAVVRQSSFTEKMHNIDWLHSPALYSTIPRLIVKYQRFVAMAKTVSHMVVPTLDVDLAWHTHQLSPRSYCHYTVNQTSTFMDHDDKVAEVRLNDAFALTSKHYERKYGEPYSECTCWYCEAVRESHTSAISRLFYGNDEPPHVADTDPRKSVHISSHNAVRPQGDASYDLDLKRQVQKLEETYEAACRRARKKGREPPKRNDYYYSDAYGYPVYMPMYIPVVAPMPCTSAYYPVGGCMAVASGRTAIAAPVLAALELRLVAVVMAAIVAMVLAAAVVLRAAVVALQVVVVALQEEVVGAVAEDHHAKLRGSPSFRW